MNGKIKFILALLFFAMFEYTIAQVSEKINGIITDQNTGQPIAGADIHVKGYSAVSVSSAAGTFSLDVPADSLVLLFTHVSYKPKEVQINGS